MITFEDAAWADYLHWQQTDKVMLRRINSLIRDIQREPFDGIGKPEPLRFNFAGYWSRRIEEEHRIVYKIQDDEIIVAQLRGHYELGFDGFDVPVMFGKHQHPPQPKWSCWRRCSGAQWTPMK